MSEIDFPTSAEKQKAVLAALKNGHHLTTQICYRELGTTELRKVVCRLREKGHDIRSYKRAGEDFKHYYLHSENPENINYGKPNI